MRVVGLAIEKQAAVGKLKWPNECRRCDAPACGGHSAEAPCAGHGAQFHAILRIPRRASISFAKRTETGTGSDGSGWQGCRRQPPKSSLERDYFFQAGWIQQSVRTPSPVRLPGTNRRQPRQQKGGLLSLSSVEVGTPVARRPPHRSRRAVFPHRALQVNSLSHSPSGLSSAAENPAAGHTWALTTPV